MAYTDAEYGYSLQYPAGFLYEEIPAAALSSFEGELKSVRFYDARFKNAYPDGQVEVAIYSRDANDLTAWLAHHSAPSTAPDNPSTYFRDVSDTANTQVTGRAAISFVWFAPEAGSVHTLAFFLGDAYVFRIDYFGIPSYQTTIRSIFQEAVASLQVT